MAPGTRGPKPLVLLALAAACVVALQVILPRVFSVVLWYHLGFFAVSLAMLGFALGGLIVRRAAERTVLPGGGIDAGNTLVVAALGLILGLGAALRLPLTPSELFADPASAAALLAMGALLAVPFTALGTAVCALLDQERERVAVAYGVSFAGGAAGAWAALLLLDGVGAPRAIACIALACLLGPAVPSAGARRRFLGPGLAALVLAVGSLAYPDAVLPMESRKHFPHIPQQAVIAREWNAFSRVTFYDNPEHHGLWHLASEYQLELPRSVGVAIDEWAITSILERPRTPDQERFLAVYPPTLSFVGAPAGFDALVLGAGGGVDVLGALAAGAGHVDAVEINPLIVDAVRGRFREFSGDLYRDPRVGARVEEGRHFVETTPRRFDRILLSGVDTFAATEAGAFALSENFLYTTEAMAAYLDALKPGGIVGFTRWWFDPPRQTLRLALTAIDALAATGHDDPRACLFIARSGFHSLVLVKNGTFDEPEIDALLDGMRRRGAGPVWVPRRTLHPVFDAALDPARREQVLADYPYRVDPCTDDRPFFFENSRLRNLFAAEGDWIHGRVGGAEVLVATFLVLLALSLPLLLAGGLRRAPRSRAPLAARVRIVAPFVLIGLAYLLIEIPLLQRLSLVLGHPVKAVAVVLAGLLVGSGIGSVLSRRVATHKAGLAAIVAALVAVTMLVEGHELLQRGVHEMGDSARAVAVLLYLAVPALVMGMPFPLALRRLEGESPVLIPVAFLANGVASVLAGPLAVLIALAAGIQVTLYAGAAAYALAGLLLLPVGRGTSSAAPAA